ncbi:MAG: isoprenylcysteine carboxylmethyltransferase family protein [Bacteroidetes bacterium]|nr:MAG: isoprenylcysteine carboxylmethyltransferase family protein [Bacteroidota bacterium]
MTSSLNSAGKRALAAPVRWIIIAGVVFFIAAGTIDILRAWIFILIYAVGGLALGGVLYKKSPQLLNDRGALKPGAKQLDKLLILTYFFLAIIITPMVAGLDHRFGWNLLPDIYLYVGIVIYLVSMVLVIRPMLHNPFFEGLVRIQEEKNHKVINTGPYAVVRHPGYIGLIVGAFGMPLAFGSAWSLVPTVVMVIVIIFRTWFEDKTLQEELEGYKAYCEEVKYRLIPFVW